MVHWYIQFTCEPLVLGLSLLWARDYVQRGVSQFPSLATVLDMAYDIERTINPQSLILQLLGLV